eukprot:CAMPEP_0181207798 /NCGR_PEP_ID=MMETSP1096-20121128/21781_1 /TAXON_ID=156174 ORGANISM="Chrysochromulina ericina, Strain CCMP281" /NCGR_SAMPLE_ID=MMETSP1096 /ASSEMBLY_ACC=CAM_ASM_000453 /LENGTH=35 /DNA_ID= /DNA_START= /DNA_END= /DNA_ORIENTATION=
MRPRKGICSDSGLIQQEKRPGFITRREDETFGKRR